MDTLKVLTFNVRNCQAHDPSPNSWEERLPRIREFLGGEAPALFGVQEAYHPQVVALCDGTTYRWVGGGRDDFRRAGEFCALFYDPRRLEVLDWGNYALNDDLAAPGVRAWGAGSPRVTTWALFRDLRTAQRFSCHNTHLDDQSEEARRNGLEITLAQMATHYSECPQLLLGDFNATPESAVWSRASTVLEDASGIVLGGAAVPMATFHGWGKVRQVIDYIFVSQGLSVLDYRVADQVVDGGFLSDHYPVVVELMFGATRRPLVLA